MKIDAKKCAEEIVKIIGESNIQTASHCMTSLRFTVSNIQKVDQKALKKVKGVLGVIYAMGTASGCHGAESDPCL